MLATTSEIFKDCKKSKNYCAVGAFNVINLETIKAAVDASNNLNLPVVIQITQKTLNFAGDFEIINLARNFIENRSGKNKIALHYDHGKSYKNCKKAIELGFTSIMIDGSKLSYEENKILTKSVVEMGKKHNVSVQGELGRVPYIAKGLLMEDEEKFWQENMTNPTKTKEFVDFTGVDSLAVAIGNAHGFQKERDVPDWERLKDINQITGDLPLILHGASDWPHDKTEKAIYSGVRCFNVDTDLRTSYITTLCKIFENDCRMQDPRDVMKDVMKSVEKKIEEKMLIFRNNF